MIYFLAWLFNWELVQIIDYFGDVYITKTYINSENNKFCYLYPFTKVRLINLNKDGSCYGSTYINYYKVIRNKR